MVASRLGVNTPTRISLAKLLDVVFTTSQHYMFRSLYVISKIPNLYYRSNSTCGAHVEDCCFHTFYCFWFCLCFWHLCFSPFVFLLSSRRIGALAQATSLDPSRRYFRMSYFLSLLVSHSSLSVLKAPSVSQCLRIIRCERGRYDLSCIALVISSRVRVTLYSC